VDDSLITLDGISFIIDYNDSVGGVNAVTLTTPAAVPEASTFLTIGLGGIFAIAAVWMGRRMGVVNVLKV
jgi:hypothetical protein